MVVIQEKTPLLELIHILSGVYPSAHANLLPPNVILSLLHHDYVVSVVRVPSLIRPQHGFVCA